ncbi:response regulator [Candidatus Woesearchaeota archaeon]|nr:response regulator [Candidatus Woesearchaeota archaeon]
MEKVLVVDDRGLDYRLKEGLQGIGYSPMWARHPTDAMRVFGEGTKPSIVISDVDKHPDCNGIEFVARARDKLGPDPRIFLWSGHVGELVSETERDMVASANLSSQIHDLYLDGTIDGYMSRIPNESASADKMLDLVASPNFLLVAKQYGIAPFGDLDEKTLKQLRDIESLGIESVVRGLPVPTFPILALPVYG